MVVVDDLLTSVFFESSSSSTLSLGRDLFYENVFVYPALMELNRIVPKLRITSWLVRTTGNETADYVLAVIFLVVILGGVSNLLASRITTGSYHHRPPVAGFSSVSAVALGYVIRISGSGGGGGLGRNISIPILATFGGGRRDINFVHAYWSNVAWIFVTTGGDWYPRLVVWLIAGLAGSLYAEFHLEHVEVVVFRDVLKFFGLA